MLLEFKSGLCHIVVVTLSELLNLSAVSFLIYKIVLIVVLPYTVVTWIKQCLVYSMHIVL